MTARPQAQREQVPHLRRRTPFAAIIGGPKPPQLFRLNELLHLRSRRGPVEQRSQLTVQPAARGDRKPTLSAIEEGVWNTASKHPPHYPPCGSERRPSTPPANGRRIRRCDGRATAIELQASRPSTRDPPCSGCRRGDRKPGRKPAVERGAASQPRAQRLFETSRAAASRPGLAKVFEPSNRRRPSRESPSSRGSTRPPRDQLRPQARPGFGPAAVVTDRALGSSPPAFAKTERKGPGRNDRSACFDSSRE